MAPGTSVTTSVPGHGTYVSQPGHGASLGLGAGCPGLPGGVAGLPPQTPSVFLSLISVENFNLHVKIEIKASSERISHRTICLLSG